MFKIGDKVQTNERWVNGPTGKRRLRTAVIVGYCHKSDFVRVRWDGTKYPQEWPIQFLERQQKSGK